MVDGGWRMENGGWNVAIPPLLLQSTLDTQIFTFHLNSIFKGYRSSNNAYFGKKPQISSNLIFILGPNGTSLSFSFACPKEKDEKKKTAWVFVGPNARLLSQASRSPLPK
jgi:hypothetical protein